MESSATINIENHRSRERIRLLGEVFTPDEYVNKMLDMLDPKVWADESVSFFEPTCGHGNFVLAIAQRRLRLALCASWVKTLQPLELQTLRRPIVA